MCDAPSLFPAHGDQRARGRNVDHIGENHIGMINFAKRAANYRHHRMSMSDQVETCDGRTHYDMVCLACGCKVRVTPNPPPNGITYSGSAFAYDCNRS